MVNELAPRYLSEFLFGGPVAGPVIYYLFEIFGPVRDRASSLTTVEYSSTDTQYIQKSLLQQMNSRVIQSDATGSSMIRGAPKSGFSTA